MVREVSTAWTALACAACLAHAPPPRPAPNPSPQELELAAAEKEAPQALSAKDSAGVDRALARAQAAAGNNVWLENRAAQLEATICVERDDAAGALRILSARSAALPSQHPSQLNLHDRMIFLCELAGDLACAQLEAEEMRAIVERGAQRWSAEARQGSYWQRAHTLRNLAETMAEPNRTTAIRYASLARDEFAALAHASGRALDSIVLLDMEFAALDRDCTRALAMARSLKAPDLDPQDAFTTSRVFDRCGDHAAAAALRQRIEATSGFNLFDAAYRQLARHVDAQAAPRS